MNSIIGENYNIGSILVKHGVGIDCWGEGPDGCVAGKRAPMAGGGEEARNGKAPLHLSTQWVQKVLSRH